MATMISEAGIYAIRHVPTQRCYVGSAIGLRKRWRAHRQMLRNGVHHSVFLQNAWNKYQEQQFEFVILEAVSEKTDLVAREQHWIDAFRSSDRKFGYNVCPWAYSKLGTTTSEATKKKQSLAMQGFKPVQTEEFLRKSRVSWLGKTQPAEMKAKRSASLIGKKRAPFSETHRRNISLAKRGLVVSEDTRAKLSRTTAAYWERKRAEAIL